MSAFIVREVTDMTGRSLCNGLIMQVTQDITGCL